MNIVEAWEAEAGQSISVAIAHVIEAAASSKKSAWLVFNDKVLPDDSVNEVYNRWASNRKRQNGGRGC